MNDGERKRRVSARVSTSVLALACAITACRDRAPAPESLPPPPATLEAPVADASVAAPAPAPAAWPDLPTTHETVAALIARSTITAPFDASADDVTVGAAIDAAAHRGWSRQVAGDDPIRRAIERWLSTAEQQGRAAYLLFGTMHDSGAHVDAFRRIVGPGGARGFSHVVVEQLRADGAWGGVAPQEQRGDGAVLADWLARGDASSFDALARFHAEHDYAAWKFGYADRVMDLLVGGRALGKPIVACDMPPSLQAKVTGARPSEELDRVRELHCLFALRDAVARTPPSGKPHVAMLWGDAHTRPSALLRFLPADAAVMTIHVFGRRPGRASPDRAIGERVVVVDPLLVSLDDSGRARALLLPDDSVDVDRVRRHEPMEAADSFVRVRADVPARIWIDDREPQAIGTTVAAIKITPGAHTWSVEAGEGKNRVTLVGAVDVPAAGAAELSFDQTLDAKKRWTRIEYVVPTPK